MVLGRAAFVASLCLTIIYVVGVCHQVEGGRIDRAGWGCYTRRRFYAEDNPYRVTVLYGWVRDGFGLFVPLFLAVACFRVGSMLVRKRFFC